MTGNESAAVARVVGLGAHRALAVEGHGALQHRGAKAMASRLLLVAV